jgi:VIT1/CCC1 family predicted Fe2+/Mn2+ transporter
MIHDSFYPYSNHSIKKIVVMPILTVVLVLIAVGVVLWLINRYIPMQSTIKNLLNAVVVIVVVIWLLKIFGVWGSLQNLHT